MSRYMLDTDTCSYVMKRSNDRVLKRLETLPVREVCISVISKAELSTASSFPRDEAALKAFLDYAEVSGAYAV